MTKHNLTRRGFVAAGASAAFAACCAGGLAVHTLTDSANASNSKAVDTQQINTLCDGCANKCAIVACVQNGKVKQVRGSAGHPTSQGHVCARGLGLVSAAYSAERLKQPMKKVNGKFEEISWESAYSEIGSALKTAGSNSAIFQARDNFLPYTSRFAKALKTSHFYTNAALTNSNVGAAAKNTVGGMLVPDVKNTKFALLVGGSEDNCLTPAQHSQYSALCESGGGKVVLASTRMSAFGRVCEKWLSVTPGCELAFLVGIASQLVTWENYNKEFVEKYASGFSAFAKKMREYDIQWASEKSGVSTSEIASVAAELASNAPASFVYAPANSTFAASYKNSFEAYRMVYLINAMLGNINQPGGMVLANVDTPSESALEQAGITALDAPDSASATSSNNKLGSASCLDGLDAISSGNIKAALFVETNPLLDWPGHTKVKEALEKLDCLVVADEFMTDTAQAANYVLPLDSYLESDGTPCVTYGTTPVLGMRHKAVERINAGSRSINEVVCELANKAGVGAAFDFSLEEMNSALISAYGAKPSSFDSASFAPLSNAVKKPSNLEFKTASGKVEFSSTAIKDAGGNEVCQWVEPAEAASVNSPVLIAGQQNIHNKTFTTNASKLLQISKKYGLEVAWINPRLAEIHHIDDGDKVKLTTQSGSVVVQVKVTSCTNPACVWLPVHYGATSGDLKDACNFGESASKLLTSISSPLTSSALFAETKVSIEKAGA